MTKRLESKHKIDRRLGVNLWGRTKSPINKRNTSPGQHGQNRRKPSDYGVQLRSKQKMRGYYNITEKQFRRLYTEAARRQGDTGENLVALLESRLDAIIYRSKFAPTIFCSRQFVSHGLIKVNGKRVNIPSYSVRIGDVIEIQSKMAENIVYLQAISSGERDVPEYIEVDHKALKTQLLRLPALNDVPYPVKMEPNLVTEYYSR
jgi:small subunit ribosomal protein S4